MPVLQTILLWYLAAVNVLGAVTAIVDKSRARRREWRVPESTLMFVGAIGGAAGMLLAMLIIRHKIRKPKFMVGLPVFLAAHLALLWFLFRP